jgi:phage gp29-like protein
MDRQAKSEQSPGITPSSYANLFNNALKEGNTTDYFKFLEEIAEKDPDILEALQTRTAYVTSKVWQIEDAEGETEDTFAMDIETALREIPGNPMEGLLTIDGLIASLLGSSYLTGLSFSEIVGDGQQVVGFNHIPAHFLTFQESVFYPNLWTQESQTGVPFNPDKMISHYLSKDTDPARGYLGNAIAWQYVFKRSTFDERSRFEKKYGKGFFLVNMPTPRDGFEENWQNAERLINNYDKVDGAVFEGEVDCDFKESIQSEGDYFWNAEDHYKSNITRIILGQESTSSVQDSNRSTADVHMEVLEQRTMDDITNIEDTLNRQLIPKIKELLGIGEDQEYYFKFVVSELEATLDEDIDEEGAIEDTDEPVTETQEDDSNE